MSCQNILCHFLKSDFSKDACEETAEKRNRWSDLLALPRTEVSVDWWGRKLHRPFRFVVARDSKLLFYLAEVPSDHAYSARHQLGSFVDDLAEPDTAGETAELFIMRPDGSYVEMHITSDGAWWYMNFTDYRKRSPRMIPAGVSVHSEPTPGGWLGSISLPLELIAQPFGPGLRAQAALALCTEGEPVYVTSAGVPGFPPDFHDQRAFCPLRL